MNVFHIVLIIGVAGVLTRAVAVILRNRRESAGAAQVDWEDLRAELVAQLELGDKIEAVRVYRKRTRSGLREARNYVEDLARDNKYGWL